MTSTTHDSRLTTTAEDARVRRFEIAAVLAITLLGFLLRVAFPSHAAIEHFDEGVYATRLWFADGDDVPYPDRHLYAPPLVPWMVRWSVDLFGPGFWGAMLPAVAFGTLTIPLVWWTARRWFGGAAGLAGAVLAAGSDFHALYSRTALTDVPLCFWLLASVYCAWESFRAGSFRWAVAAGIAAGLAWWTKYNGWLAVAIAGAGFVPWLLRISFTIACRRTSTLARPDLWPNAGTGKSARSTKREADRSREADGVELRPARPSAWRVVGCWIVLAVVACGVWSPVLLGLQKHGGYGVVAANHRTYIVGIEGWWDTLLQQAANHRLLDGIPSWAAVAVACSMPFAWRLAAGLGLTAAGCAVTMLTVLLALLLAAGYDSTRLLAITASVGIAMELLAGWKRSVTPTASRELAAWLLAAWFCGLLLATPLYRAYPRLTLPWLVATWLGSAAAIGRLGCAKSWNPQATGRGRYVPAGVLCALVLWGLPAALGNWQRVVTAQVISWQDRTAVAEIAEAIISLAPRARGRAPIPYVVYVYAEPSIVFHLTERGIVAQPASNLDFVHKVAAQPQVPTFFVAGPHALRTPEFSEQWEHLQSRFELWFDARYTPSGLVALNLYDSRGLDVSQQSSWPDSDVLSRTRPEPIRVYRVH